MPNDRDFPKMFVVRGYVMDCLVDPIIDISFLATLGFYVDAREFRYAHIRIRAITAPTVLLRSTSFQEPMLPEPITALTLATAPFSS